MFRFMICRFGWLAVLVTGLLVDPVGTAQAAQKPTQTTGGAAQRIAAVVNNDVISVRDLNARMGIVMATGQLPNTPDVAQRLAPQILRALIDEKLKLQEALRAGAGASEDDMKQGIRRLEQQNNLPPGGLERSIRGAGLDWDSMLMQVKAEMSWINYVKKSLVSRVNVSNEELSIYENQLKRNLGQPEYLVAEIFLAVDSPAQEAEVSALADRLIEQMKKGANFSALARQFSRASSAQHGGDMGWVGPGDIDQDVFAVLSTLQPGNLSKPIRTFGGYEIVLLRGARTAGSAGTGTPLARVVLPTRGPKALPSDRLESLRTKLKSMTGCDAFNALAVELGAPSSPVAMVNPQTMPPQLQKVVAGLGQGQVSAPLGFEDADVYLMVCPRPADGLPPRDELRERLAQRKLEGLSQRKMRDLRQQAIIDVRL